MNRILVILFLLLIMANGLLAQELPPIKIDYASQVLTADGRVLGYIGEKNRVDLRSTGYVSKYVIYCLLATEDRDFYNHKGVSYKGVLRGVLKTLTAQPQGGSTLTMQLIKNLFLSSERTISRKLTEIELAKKLEEKFTKDQILLMYLNDVYFGHGVYGIWAAAQEYFGKTPDKLTIPESAALVGLLKNPTGYDPLTHPEKMLSRRNEVMYNLVETGKISESEFKKLKKTGLNLNLTGRVGNYFIEHVRKEAVGILHPYGKSLNTDELIITTTCLFDVQKAAYEAVKNQWSGLGGGLKNAQVGLISLDNGTGMIRAMVGGNPDADYRGLNRAVQIKRQPGSSFKAVLYGSLLHQGYSLATPLLDAPIIVDSGKVNEWRPENSEESSTGGNMPMQQALQHSVNLCAADAITRLTVPDSVVSFAHLLGIKSELPPYPSLALGSAEVSPLEMASAYSVYASEGMSAEPWSIIRIADKNGRVYYNGGQKVAPVLDSATCFLITDGLRSVVDSGTATSVRRYYKGFAAGKTGTTNNYTDAWFVGYTSELTTAIWVGFDNPANKLYGAYRFGGTACAPIWGRMMAAVPSRYRGSAITQPPTVLNMNFCLDSGGLATNKCTRVKTYPANMLKLPADCPIHRDAFPPPILPDSLAK